MELENKKTRIAIISDIHGNLEALKETLKDIKTRNVDKIICLGDIISKGIHSRECIKLVRENCDIVIRGNNDRHYSSELNKEKYDGLSELEKERFNWNNSMLNDEERMYLQNLPFCYEFYMSGSLIRLFHGAPDSDKGNVFSGSNYEQKFKMFVPTENTISNQIADCVIYGHIHQAFMDMVYNRTLINVGSVGNALNLIRNPKRDGDVRETTKANYLIVTGEYGSKKYGSDISYEFVKVSYNIDKELENQDENIEKEAYKLELKEGIYRDKEKLFIRFKDNGIDFNKI
ncbi:MAG: metallophosphoesterase family protein [Clostridia bacterium]|nr:metallophosphoesterase family protein [Clostridia bacterium]